MPIRLKTGSLTIDAWFLIHHNYHSLLKCEEELFSKTELSLQQFHALHIIMVNDNAIMPIAVADWLDRNPNSITLIIDRLKKRGFVKRERDLKDRRATKLVVTDEGQEAFEKARKLYSNNKQKGNS
jgi:MarR family transcriptional regulator, transcriptional regulator for hemolysin